ncbi:MAG: hypothetical protein KC731_43565 [Myxococcales bacterium]|nr:hypothetical protein [Myxococcales bacterium]
MGDFEVGRIVPSTRDLFGAVNTGRRGLALLPLIEEDAHAADEVARLAALDVRGFAVERPGPLSLTVATSTTTTPLLCLERMATVEACQRGRFFGADGLALRAGSVLRPTVQSMRMMALTSVSPEEAAAAVADGARGLLVVGSREAVLALDVPRPTLVIARVEEIDADGLRELAGAVDAAVVPAAVHRAPRFSDLLEELDS